MGTGPAVAKCTTALLDVRSPNFATGRAHTSQGVLSPILTTHRAFAIGVVFSAVFVRSGGTHSESVIFETQDTPESEKITSLGSQ